MTHFNMVKYISLYAEHYLLITLVLTVVFFLHHVFIDINKPNGAAFLSAMVVAAIPISAVVMAAYVVFVLFLWPFRFLFTLCFVKTKSSRDKIYELLHRPWWGNWY